MNGPLPQLWPTNISFEDVPRSLGMKRETRGLSVGREAQMILQFDSIPDQ